MSRLRRAVLILGAFGALGGGRPAAAQTPSCKPVIDAMLKVVTTPHHVVSIDAKSARSEVIVADNTTYVLIAGAWRKSPMTPQDQLAQEQENIKDAKVYTCTMVGAENVNGIAAVAYRVHSETPDVGNADGTVWIAPSLGLPVKTEEDLTLPGAKKHISITWDYTNINAPVVK
jgi:hypothetical protein